MLRLISKDTLIDWLAKKLFSGCGYEYEERFEGDRVFSITIRATRNGKYVK